MELALEFTLVATVCLQFCVVTFQEDLLRGREVRRMRYGTDIDFEDYKPAFQKHISLKAQAVEAEDD